MLYVVLLWFFILYYIFDCFNCTLCIHLDCCHSQNNAFGTFCTSEALRLASLCVLTEQLHRSILWIVGAGLTKRHSVH